MKNSKQWWNEVKQSPELLADWLQKQYRGEVTAAKRIMEIGIKFPEWAANEKVLQKIIDQEIQHSEWILGLMKTRDINPLPFLQEEAESRYWKETLPGINDFFTFSGVAAHAEKMRLERIEAISSDESADSDIRETFQQILKDERFHEAAFRSMSTPDAMEMTKGQHELGRVALGLVP